ncbi:MAG: peroxiredoxin family protein [Gemmatimonadales bacterium]
MKLQPPIQLSQTTRAGPRARHLPWLPLAWLTGLLFSPLPAQSPGGSWRAALDLAGGSLRFSLELRAAGKGWAGRICNGSQCNPFSTVRLEADTLVLEMADYAASIHAALKGDSLVGNYRNVGSRGPRNIPFRADRGRWPLTRGSARLVGRWNATFYTDWQASPRVFELRNGDHGLEGTIISNSGDYGLFWGGAGADSFFIAHFDGSFVYLLTGRLEGDTLRGIFHAGLRSETPWAAVRSQGTSPLRPPTEVTRADTTAPFQFAFPDLAGQMISSTDSRFHGKVVLVDIFGTWCPTCHDAAPDLVRLYRDYHSRGVEIVGLAYEVSADTAVNGALVRRYRDKFGIPFPLLLAGISDPEAVAASLPQLSGFTAFPTTIFLGRDGRVRRVHAGFYGPATGKQHDRLVAEFRAEVESLLGER